MTDPSAARSFLLAEVEGLEPFEFVAAVPARNPMHVVEATRQEGGALEIRVPGRPPIVPILSEEIRGTLGEMGFASEDPDDSARPWTHGAADAEAAVNLIQEVLVRVFGEKPDAALDVGHGSHKAEHEARQKLSLARTRVEGIVTEILGHRPDQDGDGDYVLPVADVQVTVAPRVAPNGQVVVRIFVITNVGVSVVPELGLTLARLNFGLMFGRFALDAEHRAIWFDETLLGEQFREEELRTAIETVATTADAWDDRLKQMFGGVTYQEVLAGRTAEAPPPVKPGEGSGLYL